MRLTTILLTLAVAVAGFAGNAFAMCWDEPPAPLPVDQHTVNDDLVKAMSQAKLSMRFAGRTQAEFVEWKRRFSTKLRDLLGSSSPPEQWQAVEQSREQLDDHTRIHLLLTAADTPGVPVYLLIPNDLRPGEKRPGVLCVHGHGRHGHHAVVGRRDLDGAAEAIEIANYDYGLQFVRRGYVVVAPCLVPFGPRVDRDKYRSNDPCAVTFVRMQALGKLPIASNLRDLRWSLDLLQQQPQVDGDRLGCAGLSYGGRMTMLVAAVDPRIQVAAVSGALNLMQERYSGRHSCGSQMIPGLLNYGDYSEIGALIAPRPCVWETGNSDALIVAAWDDAFRHRLEIAYRAAGAVEHLHYDRFEGGHRWSGAVAFPLFDEVLKLNR